MVHVPEMGSHCAPSCGSVMVSSVHCPVAIKACTASAARFCTLINPLVSAEKSATDVPVITINAASLSRLNAASPSASAEAIIGPTMSQFASSTLGSMLPRYSASTSISSTATFVPLAIFLDAF